MKRKLFLISLIAMMAIFAMSLNAFAYSCEFGDISTKEHYDNWYADWLANPANADKIAAAVEEAKYDLTEYYGCSEGETYPAEYYASEEEYLNDYYIYYALDDYDLHMEEDYRLMNFDSYGIDPDDVNIFVNDGFLQFKDVTPIIVDARTMVPFRLIFEALNMQVGYDNNTSTVTAKDAEKQISFTLGSEILNIVENGVELQVIMDVLPYAENGRVFVPVRFVSEAYGWEVFWDADNRVVIILDKDSYVAALNKGFDEMNVIETDEELNKAVMEIMSIYEPASDDTAIRHFAGTMAMDMALPGLTMKMNSKISYYIEGQSRLLYDMDYSMTASDAVTSITQDSLQRIYANLSTGKMFTYDSLTSEEAGMEELWILEAYDETAVNPMTSVMGNQTYVSDLMPETSGMTAGEYIYNDVIGDGSDLNVFSLHNELELSYYAALMLMNDESISREGDTVTISATKENYEKAVQALGIKDYAEFVYDMEVEMVQTIDKENKTLSMAYKMSEGSNTISGEAYYTTEGMKMKLSLDGLVAGNEEATGMEMTMLLAPQPAPDAFPEVFSEKAVIVPVEMLQ